MHWLATLIQSKIVYQIREDWVESEPDIVTVTVNPVDEPQSPSPFRGIIGSGNNINMQVQNNDDSNAIAQDGNGFSSYSDQPLFQRQSTNQNSNVVS